MPAIHNNTSLPVHWFLLSLSHTVEGTTINLHSFFSPLHNRKQRRQNLRVLLFSSVRSMFISVMYLFGLQKFISTYRSRSWRWFREMFCLYDQYSYLLLFILKYSSSMFCVKWMSVEFKTVEFDSVQHLESLFFFGELGVLYFLSSDFLCQFLRSLCIFKQF